MLSVKPIVTLNKEGEVVPLEQPRTRSKAFARAAQLMKEYGELEELVIAESDANIGNQLVETLKTIYTGDIAQYKLGAVLGAHTGPGTVGIIAVTAKQ